MYCGDGRAQPRQPRSLPHPQTHWASLWPDALLGASSQSRDTVGVMGILLRTPVLQPCLPDAMKNRNTERLWRPVQLYLASNFIQPIAVSVRPVVGPFFPSGNGWDRSFHQESARSLSSEVLVCSDSDTRCTQSACCLGGWVSGVGQPVLSFLVPLVHTLPLASVSM